MTEIGTPKPYSPDELHDLMSKDPRLFQSFAAVAKKMQEIQQQLHLHKLYLFSAIVKTGPVTVGPDEIAHFKNNFSAFSASPGPVEKSFIFDIARAPIGQEAPAPDGTKDNKPIAQ